MFENDCLIDNPYYAEDELTEEDCKVCQELSGSRLTNVSQDVMATDYLFNEIPVIITDATRNWPLDLKNFDINTLKDVSCSVMAIEICGDFSSLPIFKRHVYSVPYFCLKIRMCSTVLFLNMDLKIIQVVNPVHMVR